MIERTGRRARFLRRARVGMAAAMLCLVLAACNGPPGPSGPSSPSGRSGAPRGTPSIPPLPPTPTQSLGASEPPVVYVGGTVTDVASDHVELRETSGSVVRLQRLAGGATSFFRISGGDWQELAPQAEVGAGGEACVETLMDGANLLAIRVFLGARCGPV